MATIVNRITAIDMTSVIRHYKNRPDNVVAHWFDASTMRFFHSRLPQTAYQNNTGELAYFVTSEQFDARSPRLYSVRCYDYRTQDIRTIGTFQEYRTSASATRAAKALAACQQVLP